MALNFNNPNQDMNKYISINDLGGKKHLFLSVPKGLVPNLPLNKEFIVITKLTHLIVNRSANVNDYH